MPASPGTQTDLRRHPFVLSIGITDPWAAAGVALDLYIADRLDVRLCCVITGVSAQDGVGLFSLRPLGAPMIRAQLDALQALEPAVVRIGAIPDRETVFEIARYLDIVRRPAIYDPVLATSAGGVFSDAATRAAIVDELFPRVALVTPNLDEAEAFVGFPVRDIGEMTAAAAAIERLGAKSVVVKGGHLEGSAVDVLFHEGRVRRYDAPRLEGSMRGTGCVFALTASAAIAYGHPIEEAVRIARDIVRILFRVARPVGTMRIVP